MSNTTTRLRTFQLALVASAALGLSACSRSDPDVAPPRRHRRAAASRRAGAGARPGARAGGRAAPAQAPVVVAQNERGYEQGRRDQQRQDARRERPLPPRTDRRAPTATSDVDQQRRRP